MSVQRSLSLLFSAMHTAAISLKERKQGGGERGEKREKDMARRLEALVVEMAADCSNTRGAFPSSSLHLSTYAATPLIQVQPCSPLLDLFLFRTSVVDGGGEKDRERRDASMRTATQSRKEKKRFMLDPS